MDNEPDLASRQFKSRSELQRTYVQRARSLADRTAATNKSYPVHTSCEKIGQNWGVGVGLYFKTLNWLVVLFFILSVAAVPFFVVINTSVFTDAEHKDDHSFGIKVYDTPTVFSFTFAAVVDSSLDNDTLQYMNTEFAGTWQGPMRKGTFLTWLSLADAGAVVLLLAGITYMTLQARRFIQTVDSRTLEVADFSVLVRGLPGDTSPQEVGEHFHRFGEVMDVVLVRDMGPVLEACAEASRLEQQRALLSDQLRLYNSVVYAKRAEAVEDKLEDILHRMEAVAGGPQDFPVKAAFVTFSLEREQRACLDNCPRGFWTSLLQPKLDRLRGKHRIWVSSAYAPDDYIHENIPRPWYSRWLRRVFTALVLVAVLAATAAAITRLGSISVAENQSTVWKGDEMRSVLGVAAANLAGALNATQVPTTWLAVTNKLRAVYTQVRNTSLSTGQSMDWQTYCSTALPTACAPFFGAAVGASAGFNMTYGQLLQWSNQTELLVKQRPLLQALGGCAAGDGSSDGGCASQALTLALAACLPCHCLGLAQSDATGTQSSDWALQARAQCGAYVDGWNVRSLGIRIGVALVIAGINYGLKIVVELLMLVEVHFTKSQREHEYAVLAFVAQTLNSMLVLLLVNAAPIRDLSNSSNQTWLHYLVLDGTFNDFTPAWYRDVGLSIMVIMLLQVFNPLMTITADWFVKLGQRCWILKCDENAAQPEYNKAFARPEFSLAQRVADAMLSTAVALMFGSGMPLLYIIAFGVMVVTALCERFALAKVCTVTSRYDKKLPALMIGVLPWAALVHCLFGLWMHTYFKVIDPEDIKSSGSPSTAVNAVTTTSVTGAVGARLTIDELLTRITAANGIALLVCAGVLVAWLVFRFLLWHLLRPMLTRLVQRWCCGCCVPLILGPEPGVVPYEVALLSGRLRGTATYRLPHHPAYAHVFDGSLHKAIWLRAQGHQRYTRLVSGRGGVCNLVVSSEVVTTVETRDVEAMLSSFRLPSNLTSLAARIATPSQTTSSSGSGGGAAARRKAAARAALNKRSPGANEPQPSRTVHIQVLADTPVPAPPLTNPTGSNTTMHAVVSAVPIQLQHAPSADVQSSGVATPTRPPYQPPMPAGELLALAGPRLAELATRSSNSPRPTSTPTHTGHNSPYDRHTSDGSRHAHLAPSQTSSMRRTPSAHQAYIHDGAGGGHSPVQLRPMQLAPRLYSPGTGILGLTSTNSPIRTSPHTHHQAHPLYSTEVASPTTAGYTHRYPNPLHTERSGPTPPVNPPTGRPTQHHRLMSVPLTQTSGSTSPRGTPAQPTRLRSIGPESLLAPVTRRPSSFAATNKTAPSQQLQYN